MQTIIFAMLVILLAGRTHAEEISGHYCYTYGDKESLQEAKALTRTLAIRNAVESYKTFIESTTVVKDSILSSDIIQVLANGYISNVKAIKHTEEGRTVCDTITGQVNPAKFEQALKLKVEEKARKIETEGVANNGIFKILRIEEENIYNKDHMDWNTDHTSLVQQASKYVTLYMKCLVDIDVTSYDETVDKVKIIARPKKAYVMIDYYNDKGEEIKGNSLYPILNNTCMAGQIVNHKYELPFNVSSYRIWLPKIEVTAKKERKRLSK